MNIKELTKDYTEKDWQEIKEIGRHKYAHLKSLKELSMAELLQIAKYEKNHWEFNKKVTVNEVVKKEVRTQTYDELWEKFLNIANDHVKENKPKDWKFTIDKENEEVIKFTFDYFAYQKLKGICKNPAHNKGLLIIGNYGSGKSAILEIHQKMYWWKNKYRTVSAHDIVTAYDKGGTSGISQYTVGSFNIEDIGTEDEGSHFGKKLNVMKYILEKRYLLFQREQKKTHISTNLSLTEIGEKYGGRIESRIYEMFNVLYLGEKSDSRDFRKLL